MKLEACSNLGRAFLRLYIEHMFPVNLLSGMFAMLNDSEGVR